MGENNKALDHQLVEGALPEGTLAALIYSTFPSRELAIEVGRELVERRLIGCINILPGMTSVYVWDETTEISDEVVLLAKVGSDNAREAAKALLELHPYDTPAVLVLPVHMGGRGYLDWLKAGVGVCRGKV